MCKGASGRVRGARVRAAPEPGGFVTLLYYSSVPLSPSADTGESCSPVCGGTGAVAGRCHSVLSFCRWLHADSGREEPEEPAHGDVRSGRGPAGVLAVPGWRAGAGPRAPRPDFSAGAEDLLKRGPGTRRVLERRAQLLLSESLHVVLGEEDGSLSTRGENGRKWRSPCIDSIPPSESEPAGGRWMLDVQEGSPRGNKP